MRMPLKFFERNSESGSERLREFSQIQILTG